MNQYQKTAKAFEEIKEIICKYNVEFLVFDQDLNSLKNYESIGVNGYAIQINTLKEVENGR